MTLSEQCQNSYHRESGCGGHCHANRDGECEWPECPQLRDGEPAATHRDCPYIEEFETW